MNLKALSYRIGAGLNKVLVMNLNTLSPRIGAGLDKVLVMNLKTLSPRIGAGLDKVLVMRKGPGFPDLGASPKRLDKLIRQSTPSFILPYTGYFYNEMLKLGFVVIMKIIFPYTNYSCA